MTIVWEPPPPPLGHWKWPAGRLLKNTQNTYVLSKQRDFDRKKSVAWRPPRQWDDRPMRSSHTYIKKGIYSWNGLSAIERTENTDRYRGGFSLLLSVFRFSVFHVFLGELHSCICHVRRNGFMFRSEREKLLCKMFIYIIYHLKKNWLPSTYTAKYKKNAFPL